MTQAPERTGPSPLLLWGLIAVMTLLWTANPLAGKVALREVPPVLLIAVRTTIAGFVILLVLLNDFRKGLKISLRDWLMLGAFGVVLQLGNQMLFVNGLSKTSVSHVAFIYALTPVLILCLAAGIGQERFTLRKILGMAISVCGVALLARDQAGGEATIAGDAIVFCGIFTFAAFSVFGKSLRQRFGSIVMNAASYMTGAVVFQPLIWGVYGDFDLTAVSATAWSAVVFMAVFPAVIGYLIYYWALGHAPASRIAAVQYVQPPLATTLGALFLAESVTATLLVAGAFILVGVFLTERG